MPDRPPKVPAHLLGKNVEDPDIVTKLIARAIEKHPEIAGEAAQLEEELRAEFWGRNINIRKRNWVALYAAIRADFNGRNTKEIMARYAVSRATVHRIVSAKVAAEA